MSTENNTVAAAAVEAYNKNLTEQTQQAAVRLIGRITEEQAKIAGCHERIKARQDELAKIASDVIDEARVFGGSVPTNANRETIVKVIEKANKDRQYGIESSSQRLTGEIVAEQDAIAVIQGRITKLQEELTRLSTPTVTVAQVVG